MSRRRLYLDIKESILDLFRTTARWLHDSIQKESMYEKPYLNRDYRKMHLNIPVPDWPSTKIPGGDIPDRPKTWTFIWDPGICTLGVASPDCGEEFTLGVSIGLLPPGSEMKTIEWSATADGCVSIIKIDQGISGTIHAKAADTCEEGGKGTICVKGKLVGTIRDTLVVANPFDKTGVLDYRVATHMPAFTDTYRTTGFSFDCGCIDFDLDCCGTGTIAYDFDNSAATVAKNSSAIVYITDTGNVAPYTWSIGGTGFWIDSAHTKTTIETSSKYILVYADGNACGPGTISITDCNGIVATGSIRCTTGEWVQDYYCSNFANCGLALCGAGGCEETLGMYRYHDQWCPIGLSLDCATRCVLTPQNCTVWLDDCWAGIYKLCSHHYSWRNVWQC